MPAAAAVTDGGDAMQGEVCWLEANTPDADGAMKFYTGLFDWERGPGEVGFPYTFLKRPGEGRNFGGLMPLTADAGPPRWRVYFAVDDLDAAVEKAAGLGGRVVVPTVTIPAGKFAVLTDPHGAEFALYQGA